jgi:hypothetical protein
MVFRLRSVDGCVLLAACVLIFGSPSAFSQTAPDSKGNAATQQALLPDGFSGWTSTGAANTGTAAGGVDSADADVLNEYGLKDFAEKNYRRGSNRLDLRALRFADATGAYGAFTFYRKNDMKPETVGNQGSGDANEIVFWSGVTLVDARFDHSAGNEISALKALVKELPSAPGSDAVAPTLPQYLPQSGLGAGSVRYAIGPVAYTRMGGVLPPALIDFSRDAEAVIAQYEHRPGAGTLTILEYPTPQIANDRAKAIEAFLKGPLPESQQANPAAMAVKRSGPLVAITSGSFSAEEAQALLAQVKYKADLTWNRPGNSSNEVKRAAEMLVGIAYLTAFLAGCALLLGFFLGGGRALWRTMHGKPISAVYEEDFISLNLNEETADAMKKLP